MFGQASCTLLPPAFTAFAAPPNHRHYTSLKNCFQTGNQSLSRQLAEGKTALLPPPTATNLRTQNQICLLRAHAKTCTCFCTRMIVIMCVRAPVAAETAWLKQTDKKHLKQKKGKKCAHTTTCQERNASNFSVICQPFNKTRALCPHTPPSSHKRRRWREEDEETRMRRRQTEHQICLFPIWNHSTHLTFPFSTGCDLSLVLFIGPPSPPQTAEEQSVYL